MRPIKLEMSAFLSYGEEQIIDFTKLGDNGLYLITGDTGAGKTTIFDAITYALYGEASGAMRDGKMFRSKYAGPDKETYVKLTFECNGKEYIVTRKPEYERTKLRGEGTTKSIAEALLEFSDGRPNISKLDEVTKEIEKIIGLTKDQFSQIAMIAQGQFRELLVADTKTRREIFRHIFETGNFEELQRRINADYAAIDKEKNEVENAIKIEVDHINCEEGTFDRNRVSDLDFLDNDIILKLSGINEEDSSKLDELKNNKLELAEMLEKATGKVAEAKNYESNVSQLEIKEKYYQDAKINAERAADELEEARKNDVKIKELSELIILKNESLKDYESLSKYIANLDEDKKQIEVYNDKKRKLSEKQEKDKAELERQIEEQKTLENVETEIVELKNRREKAEEAQKDYNEILSRIKKLTEMKADKEAFAKECIKAQNHAKELAEQYDEFLRRYISDIAGSLALDLKPGNPCPVCGSKEHIRLAVLPKDAVTKEQVDEKKKEAETAGKTSEEKLKQLERKNAEVEKFEEETVNHAAKYSLENDISVIERVILGLCEKNSDDLKMIDDTNSSLQIKKTRNDSLNISIPKLRETIETQNNTIGNWKTETAILETDKTAIEKQIAVLKEKLEFDSITEAKENIKKLELEKEQFEMLIKNAEDNLNKINGEKSELEGAIRQLKDTLEKSEKLSLEEQTVIFEEIKVKTKQNDGELQELSGKLSNNKTVLEIIKEKREKLSTVLVKHIWLKNLEATVSGKLNNGNGKIMLETYIQQAYFDRIVNKANKRFEKMTQNRYTLSRIKEAVDNKSQGGLDLEIIDHYNSSRRTVKSLSGGEQFEASLSMALGLSDMVQEASAGVKLDCMFIDEGFGSLDDESLHHALMALKDLSDGNRQVGIISHVKELEREIDKKIVVKKDARGFSKAEIKCNY